MLLSQQHLPMAGMEDRGSFPSTNIRTSMGKKKAKSWALNLLEKFPCKALMTVRSPLQTKSSVGGAETQPHRDSVL